MFDLEFNISSWSDYLSSSTKLNKEDIIELENQLRQQIEELLEKGLSEEEAFLISVKRLRDITPISEEYSKVNIENIWKQLMPEPAARETKKKFRDNIFLIVILSLLAGTAAKIPTLFGLDMDSVVYFKNLSFFILPFIVFFFMYKHDLNKRLILYITGIFVLSGVIINLYPSYNPHHTALLMGIHLPILLWLVTGVAYLFSKWKLKNGRMDFIRFTGESFIYGTLVMLGLMVLMMFTGAIFGSIGIDIESFIENYFIFYAGTAAAMITVYLVETKKNAVENFAPILAKIFSPLFLITMVIFLLVILITGNSPFVERDFLIAFDLMLVLVLGMVLYIISAKNIYDKTSIFDYLNTALIFVAVIVDCVALSAILFRLSEYGISPNKLAALGENLLLLVNLAALLWLYILYFMKKIKFESIEVLQTRYLTVYAVWMAVVVFVFPLVFRFQ